MVYQKRSGGAWYFDFWKNGKRFRGTCEGATSKRTAEAFEKTVREKALQAAGAKTAKALYESFREDLTGGSEIKLSDAFELSLKKPRKRVPAEKLVMRKREIFNDFIAFMQERYPETVTISEVQPKHAEEYIALIRASGRFRKTVSYTRGGKTLSRQTTSTPSNKTVNDYLQICAEVFSLLARDAGLIGNPFDVVPKLKKEEETREAFTPEELILIRDNLDDFTRPLFSVALTTALREGDICTLKWTDVDLKNDVIQRRMNKTGHVIQIPVMPDLHEYLLSQPSRDKSEFVFPEHAAMYRTNPTGISYRVKQFLEGIGIKTTRKPEGRERAVSVKDLHSCRHTFCYFAGMRGIPLATVQSIVGHMTPEMTAHYSAHATMQNKRDGMKLMTGIMDIQPQIEHDPERAELKQLADTLPIEKIRIALKILTGERNA